MVELLCKWRRASAELQDELGRPPTLEEIARASSLPKKKLAIIKKAIKVYNLVPQTDQPENGWSLGEMLMDERTRDARTSRWSRPTTSSCVMHLLDEMDKREATVLRMRFGLDDAPPKTLKEIGESLGLTRERVRQIENEALGKLSATLRRPTDRGPRRWRAKRSGQNDEGRRSPFRRPSLFPGCPGQSSVTARVRRW